jgi:hypothetical protein
MQTTKAHEAAVVLVYRMYLSDAIISLVNSTLHILWFSEPPFTRLQWLQETRLLFPQPGGVLAEIHANISSDALSVNSMCESG